MKKSTKLLSFALSLLMMISCWCITPVSAATTSLSGSGTAGDPYKISSADDFIYFLQNADGSTSHYKLTADISFDGATITDQPATFGGTLDGAGHTVSNFTLGKQGLFATLSGATIKDISFKGVTGTFSVNSFGVMAATASGEKTTFENCYVEATVTSSAAKQYIGGYIGNAQASIDFTNCVFDGSISDASATTIGGFIGFTQTSASHIFTFEDCANLAELSGSDVIGGFIAHLNNNTASFDNCYNAGAITANIVKAYSVFIAHFIARAGTNALTQASFENCYVLHDVPLTGGKVYSAVNGSTPVNTTSITNFCIIGYGGSNAKFALEVDHLGMNCPEYDAMTKAEFFLAAGADSSIAFHGLGDVVVIGHQDTINRGENATTYDARLIAAINSLEYNAGFEIKVGGKTVRHEVERAYRSILANGQTVAAPEGYYLITLVVTGLDEKSHSLDFTAYMDKASTVKDDVSKLLGRHEVGTYNVGDGNTMVLYRGVSKQNYNLLCNQLAASYELVQQNEANGNFFKTFFNGTEMVHAYLNTASGEMRVITDSSFTEAELPVYEDGNGGQYEVKLHMLKACTGYADGGMGFVIRLSDGRFIVIDGGSNTADEAYEIYKFMVDNNVTNGEIVIAAWIFTHEHGDHTGAFNKFAATYANAVTLEHILVNSCDTAEQTKYAGLSTDIDTQKSKFPGVTVHKPLSGQKYKFASTTIEILYTMPDVFPYVITNEPDATASDPKNGDGNTQSMIFMVDLTSQSGTEDNLLVTGDANSYGLNIVVARYGNYIQSKYLQVSHHGHVIKFSSLNNNGEARYSRRNNCVKEFYDLADPDVAFWPTNATDNPSTGKNYYEDYRTAHGINKDFFEHMRDNGQNIVASDDSGRTITIG